MSQDSCVLCGEPTFFGSGRFVNRIVADDGFMCARCQFPSECVACDERTPLEGELTCGVCKGSEYLFDHGIKLKDTDLEPRLAKATTEDEVLALINSLISTT